MQSKTSKINSNILIREFRCQECKTIFNKPISSYYIENIKVKCPICDSNKVSLLTEKRGGVTKIIV